MASNTKQPRPAGHKTNPYDVIVIGAGAAGLMCAMTAGKRGRSVIVLDHANRVGKKILMSGGGRCNFTNLYTSAEHFLSHNPHFCKSALARYSPWNFIELVDKHAISYHEKKLGQLFCDDKAQQIVTMLLHECEQAGVELKTGCSLQNIERTGDGFRLQSSEGNYSCDSLVIASGGLSIPTLGASAFGYEVARQFGLAVRPLQAALVPFTLNQHLLQKLQSLSGTSCDARVSCAGHSFHENILFTHRGLSGPAILQISSYWKPGATLTINLLPDIDVLPWLQSRRSDAPTSELKTHLAQYWTRKMAEIWCQLWLGNGPMQSFSNVALLAIAAQIEHWSFKPPATEGYRTAEVTLGGVDTEGVSSQTMQAKSVPGLYFVGEVLDVTGQLGGFNLQWAWASGYAAGRDA